MKKLDVRVPYEQPIEIRVEFPLSILYEYNGPSNLDVTWDDHIMYLINVALDKAGAYRKKGTLEEYPIAGKNEEVLSYLLTLIVQPPGLNLYGIVEDLTQENFQKGLCIKLKSEYHGFEIIYADPFALI